MSSNEGVRESCLFIFWRHRRAGEEREVCIETNKRRGKCESRRCDERLKTKSEESTLLGYTGLFGELEHLKIETRLIDEMFVSVMGEYVFLK